MPRGSNVSGWQFLPLKQQQQREQEEALQAIVRAARVLAEQRLVRCTNFAFEQRVVVRTPTGHPGVMREEEAHTMDPDEGWMAAHARGTYRLEVCVQVNQEDRAPVGEAPRVVQLVAAPRPARKRRRRPGDVLRCAELARVLAQFRRDEVREARA